MKYLSFPSSIEWFQCSPVIQNLSVHCAPGFVGLFLLHCANAVLHESLSAFHDSTSTCLAVSHLNPSTPYFNTQSESHSQIYSLTVCEDPYLLNFSLSVPSFCHFVWRNCGTDTCFVDSVLKSGSPVRHCVISLLLSSLYPGRPLLIQSFPHHLPQSLALEL